MNTHHTRRSNFSKKFCHNSSLFGRISRSESVQEQSCQRLVTICGCPGMQHRQQLTSFNTQGSVIIQSHLTSRSNPKRSATCSGQLVINIIEERLRKRDADGFCWVNRPSSAHCCTSIATDVSQSRHSNRIRTPHCIDSVLPSIDPHMQTMVTVSPWSKIIRVLIKDTPFLQAKRSDLMLERYYRVACTGC